VTLRSLLVGPFFLMLVLPKIALLMLYRAKWAGDSEDLSFPLSEAMPTAHIAIRTLKSNFLCGIASSSSLSAVRSTTMGSAVLAFALKLLFS
jgi:hypothetical protein